MENPEEVLLVLLQEFQKLRPSEIPRELEDYLCWVARTGDPVFQWSLIKALFREKLMRVMTDFYENCPSLDLTPCPNVDQFNYDIMKSNLLDRLESFANAPFTVQRICELLTTPRKEYNRIDKFMRAIEKNLLVVSTREPGPYGRRSENGDSMVNGSVDDETSHHGQTSNEVEMDNWVKDCTVTTDVPMNSGNEDDMSIENGLNSPKKSSFGKHDKMEHLLSAVDTTASSFTPSSADFPSAAATTTTQEPTTETVSVVQNLTTINHEAPTIVGDVSDVIMNEDTSSQPSLELESDDNDSCDSKKLQTSFQAKDFTLDEEKPVKTYSEVLKGLKPEEDDKSSEESKEKDESIETSYTNDKVSEENICHLKNSDKIDNLGVDDSIEAKTDTVDARVETEAELTEKCESESNVCLDNFPIVNNNLDEKKDDDEENVISDLSEALIETKEEVDVNDQKETEPVTEESIPDTIDSTANVTEDLSEKEGTETLSEISTPIIEEPSLETTDSSPIIKTETTNVTIEESIQDDTNVTKTAVPDPIPIIEEPKEIEPVTKEWEDLALVSEVESETKETSSSAIDALGEMQTKVDIVEENQMVTTGCVEEQSSKGPSESMDVDNEALTSAQQDEPMEEETTEAMNS